jgi:DNA-directed RNA polymerase subunit omega
MMLYPAMNELLEQVPSRYQLVNVVAAKARKIASRAEREDIMLEDKPVSIAIREIAEGKLEDEAEPEETAELLPEEEPEEEPQEETFDEE